MLTVDPAVLSICARVAMLCKDDRKITFAELTDLVGKLYADVIADVESAASSWIVRHHLFADLGQRTLHCVCERVGAKWVVNFYVSDLFSAEPAGPVMMEFVGTYANTADRVN